MIKGKSILTDDNSLETRSLEVRINIQRRILRVGSLPNYESVVQADNPNKIDPATPYRFFLLGLNSKTKMTITRLEKVIEFNSLMWAIWLLNAFEILIKNSVELYVQYWEWSKFILIMNYLIIMKSFFKLEEKRDIIIIKEISEYQFD